MKDKAHKFWPLILSQLLSQSSSPSVSITTGCLSVPQLNFLYTSSSGGLIEAQLLRDVSVIVNMIGKDRFMSFGMMTVKDITNTAIFADLIARYLLDHQKPLIQYKSDTFTYQDHADLYKSCTLYSK